MQTTCRLRIIGWLYTIVGIYALIETLVGLFALSMSHWSESTFCTRR